MIETLCECGFMLKAGDEYAGRKVGCPKCRRATILPSPAAVAPSVVPIPVSVAMTDTTEEDDDFEFDDLPTAPVTARPPIARAESKPDSNPFAQLEHSAFRRFFPGTWFCVWVLRVVAVFGFLGTGLLVLLMTFGIIGVMNSKPPKPDPERPFARFEQPAGVVSVLTLFTPLIFGTFTAACIVLAGSELLTAFAWSKIREGVGGHSFLVLES